jgi:hypothetical protein
MSLGSAYDAFRLEYSPTLLPNGTLMQPQFPAVGGSFLHVNNATAWVKVMDCLRGDRSSKIEVRASLQQCDGKKRKSNELDEAKDVLPPRRIQFECAGYMILESAADGTEDHNNLYDSAVRVVEMKKCACMISGMPSHDLIYRDEHGSVSTNPKGTMEELSCLVVKDVVLNKKCPIVDWRIDEPPLQWEVEQSGSADHVMYFRLSSGKWFSVYCIKVNRRGWCVTRAYLEDDHEGTAKRAAFAPPPACTLQCGNIGTLRLDCSCEDKEGNGDKLFCSPCITQLAMKRSSPNMENVPIEQSGGLFLSNTIGIQCPNCRQEGVTHAYYENQIIPIISPIGWLFARPILTEQELRQYEASFETHVMSIHRRRVALIEDIESKRIAIENEDDEAVRAAMNNEREDQLEVLDGITYPEWATDWTMKTKVPQCFDLERS